MKIVSAKAMANLETLAYKQGFKEEEFMEKAGAGIAREVQRFMQARALTGPILLLCGKGNNGGDAFVAGRHLLNQGYQVHVVVVDDLEACSPLCQLNRKRFLTKGHLILSAKEVVFSQYDLILDGLFGTGFKGEVKEPHASLIQSANQSHIPILAIDIPSGLDGSTGEAAETTIIATETLFLGLPKMGFFLQNGWNYVGVLRHVDFGLPPSLIEELKTNFILSTAAKAALLLPPIKRNRHKYQAGYVIGLAGSPGMPGAAILSSLAALRGGSGIVKLLHPDGMQQELAFSPYELIKLSYHSEESSFVLSTMQKAGTTFVGPGLGRAATTQRLLQEIMPLLDKPCVIDADALTLLSEHSFRLPKEAILTPHTGEMQRLLEQTAPLHLNQETLNQCQEYANQQQITLVLKGAPTFIFHPGEPIAVNPTGNPGMATAGSGDVLTGLIASLVSQGLKCREAAILGAYLHGLAGEYAAQAKTSYSMIASDIISHFEKAFLALQH